MTPGRESEAPCMSEGKETEKTPKASRSLLAVGPTLHYSHRNVQRCWLLAVVAFCFTCLVWSRLVTGTFWAFDLNSPKAPDFWRLARRWSAAPASSSIPGRLSCWGC